MNSFLIAATLTAAAIVGGFVMGDRYGSARIEAKNLAADAAVQATREAAQAGAAKAIAALKPRNTTIRQEVEREVRTNTVYADCRVTADGLRLANEAITGQPVAPGAGQLPRTVAPE